MANDPTDIRRTVSGPRATALREGGALRLSQDEQLRALNAAFRASSYRAGSQWEQLGTVWRQLREQ
jgi:hypothetical protein